MVKICGEAVAKSRGELISVAKRAHLDTAPDTDSAGARLCRPRPAAARWITMESSESQSLGFLKLLLRLVFDTAALRGQCQDTPSQSETSLKRAMLAAPIGYVATSSFSKPSSMVEVFWMRASLA